MCMGSCVIKSKKKVKVLFTRCEQNLNCADVQIEATYILIKLIIQ